MASLHWWVDPTARAKHKRMTSCSYVKVSAIIFLPARDHHHHSQQFKSTNNHSMQVKLGGGGKVCFLQAHMGSDDSGVEEYTFQQLPDLVLLDPLSNHCSLEWKGQENGISSELSPLD
jgi:hypothetical protein